MEMLYVGCGCVVAGAALEAETASGSGKLACDKESLRHLHYFMQISVGPA